MDAFFSFKLREGLVIRYIHDVVALCVQTLRLARFM